MGAGVDGAEQPRQLALRVLAGAGHRRVTLTTDAVIAGQVVFELPGILPALGDGASSFLDPPGQSLRNQTCLKSGVDP